MLYALGTVLHDVELEELEVGFVGVDWVLEILRVDGFFLVADERADSLDAGA